VTNTRQVWDKIGKYGGDSACSCVQVGTTKALLVIVVPCMLPPERERERPPPLPPSLVCRAPIPRGNSRVQSSVSSYPPLRLTVFDMTRSDIWRGVVLCIEQAQWMRSLIVLWRNTFRLPLDAP